MTSTTTVFTEVAVNSTQAIDPDLIFFPDDSSCIAATMDLFRAVPELLISIIGLILNGIAIYVIICLKDYKKIISHWYVFQLSIADVLLLLYLPFQAHQHIAGKWIFGEVMCAINQGIFMISYYAGILFLTVMSFDRYVAIVHPVSATWRRLRTYENAIILTFVVWIVSILLSLPFWLKSKAKCSCAYEHTPDETSYDYQNISKDFEAEFYSLSQKTWEYSGDDYYRADQTVDCRHRESKFEHALMISNFAITFVFPVTVMAICYSLILWRVLHPAVSSAHATTSRRRKVSDSSYRKDSSFKNSMRSHVSSTSSASSYKMSRKQKVTLIVVLLVTCFLLCWFPFHLVHMIRIKGLPFAKSEDCAYLNDITHLLAYVNSMLNPILYTFLASDFCIKLRTASRSLYRRKPSGFSKGRSARTSIPTYGRSYGHGCHKTNYENHPSYPPHSIHSMVSKHSNHEFNDRSQLMDGVKKEYFSKCDEALHFSDVSDSRLIH